MFSSFSSFSSPFSLPRFLRGDPGLAISIPPVATYDVETHQEKRARALKHFLKLNHVTHSIVYHNLQFHNHMPHILGSAYLLGAKAEQLHDIYEAESRELEKWEDSPGEISKHDWRDYLGNHRYQKAYVDFFEDELVLNGYDWRKVLDEYMFQGEEPLINCLIAGLGHPLIHLGYAYELSSRELAMEALGLITTSYNFLHRYLDDTSYTKPVFNSTTSLLEILERVSNDDRIDGLFAHHGAENTESLFDNHEDVILEHWNSWCLLNPKKQFEDSQKAAAALFVATQGSASERYDFFLVHLLTSSHAIRILLPFIPTKFHVSLVRQWWLFVLTVYIAQLRPPINLETITNYELNGKDWDWLSTKAVDGKWARDAHYVKALRALRETAQTWGDKDLFYLKAAAKFGVEFDGWGGFGPLREVC